MINDKTVLQYRPLVEIIARKYKGMGVPIDDLIQEGLIGLMEAAKRFKPETNIKFSTYATFWVKKRILKAVNKEYKDKINTFSLDEYPELSDNIIVDNYHPEVRLVSDLVNKLFKELTADERKVLSLLYGLDGRGPRDLATIAEEMKTTRTRVWQIKEMAFRRMRVVNLRTSLTYSKDTPHKSHPFSKNQAGAELTES